MKVDVPALRKVIRDCKIVTVVYTVALLFTIYMLIKTGDAALVLAMVLSVCGIIMALGVRWAIERALGDW